MQSLESEFETFRRSTVGHDQTFVSAYGRQRIVYADWTASGRLYGPIERRMTECFGPYVGNTHSESSVTGTAMTRAYRMAKDAIRAHANAGAGDVLIPCGSGMTGAINKLQRLLGLRVPERLRPHLSIPEAERPVVFVTHMEHHSNHTSWLESVACVECVQPDDRGRVDLESLRELLHRHRDRPTKIGAFTACSNVTGIRTPLRELSRIMHEHGGLCLVDYAASAPYASIDMHPADPMERLDAVVYSPHKFLGGPGSAGILLFDSALHHDGAPDQPGGGTVSWTNPWGEYRYVDDIEEREDGGTPAFLQTIRAALCIALKEEMGIERMRRREAQLTRAAFAGLGAIPGVHLLAEELEDRLPIFSFYTEGVHYNLMVRLLNDRFGVQARGGCSCAGTYGHYLLHVDPTRSRHITDRIDRGDLSEKPGWVRVSLHPTTTDAELDLVIGAIAEVARNHRRWAEDYVYSPATNEFTHRDGDPSERLPLAEWLGQTPHAAVQPA